MGPAFFRKFTRSFGFSRLTRKVRTHCKMSTVQTGLDDFLYIAFPDKPTYLKHLSKAEQSESKPVAVVSMSKCVDSGNICYLVVSRKCHAVVDTQENYLRSAIDAQEIYRLMSSFSYSIFSHFDVFSANILSAFNCGGRIKRGVCISCTTSESTSNKLVEKLQKLIRNDLMLFKLQQTVHGTFTLKSADLNSETDQSIDVIAVDRDSVPGLKKLGAVESPVFAVQEISPVFQTYQEARDILLKLIERAEVQELLDIADLHVSTETIKSSNPKLLHPFVVVEGMDATGKTTQTEVLEKRMGAARHCTPPPEIAHLRPAFDKLPEVVRRAYYSVGNYIVAGDIIKECQKRPVIMDRFWHSTAAYGIANESSYADLPTGSNPVYQWPRDLLRPTLVVFLTVTEEIRKQRLAGRGQPTFEEKSLDRDQLFRTRLCEAYRLMRSPSCVEVDAGGTVQEVTKKVQDVLQENGVNLDTTIDV